MDCLLQEQLDPKRSTYAYPTSSHYKLRYETTVPMKAKAFFESVVHGDMDDFLAKVDIQIGEVIEIDDGLKPYYFYCLGCSRIIPALLFDRLHVQKNKK